LLEIHTIVLGKQNSNFEAEQSGFLLAAPPPTPPLTGGSFK
jgi:hypothetical protein